MIGTYVRVRVAAEHYALPVEVVLEVRPRAPLTPVPGAPAHFVGVMNLGGEVLPVVDFAAVLGLAPSDELGEILVVEGESGRAGLAVDAVTATGPLPELSPTRDDRGYVLSTSVVDGRLTGVVDLNAALAAAAWGAA